MNNPPTVGTRDFFEDAAQQLSESKTPHILICGFVGSKWRYRSSHVTTLEGLEWFRSAINELLDTIEDELSEDDGEDDAEREGAL